MNHTQSQGQKCVSDWNIAIFVAYIRPPTPWATELGITLGRTRTMMTVDRALEPAGKAQIDGKRWQ